MKNTKLEDYIYIVKNALSHEICDEIINEFKESDAWEDTLVKSARVVDKSIRNCMSIGMSYEHVIQNNKNVRQKLDNGVFHGASKCIQEYVSKFRFCNIKKDTGYQLLKYNEGNFYIQHTDSFLEQPRTVSCSFVLNDDFEGGEFAFFDRELKYKLEKGDALMFPSNFMYPHEVMPVTKGTRYSIVTWFI